MADARIVNVLGVVGTGAMGAGIAQIAAQAGIAVRLLDARPGAAASAAQKLGEVWAGLAAKGRMNPEAVEAAKARLHPIASDAELAGCDVVIEAIVEDLGAKKALFAALEPIVGTDCVLATNTSSLSVTAIAASCTAPGRVGGFHFFNPVPLMKVVEVIDGALTEPAVGATLTALATRMGHRPVRCIDSPGFIVNHAGRGFGTEALRIVAGESAARPVDVDRALRDQVGFRMGPFELLDLTALDVSQPVMESIYRQYHEEPRYRPSWLLRQRLDAGLLGRKVGRGFYAYRDGKAEPLPEQSVPVAAPRPVWVWGDDPDWEAALASMVRDAGWPVETASRPSDAALCLLAPLGDDVTAAAQRARIDPARCVAVDALFGLAKRRVLMTNPATHAEFAAAGHALLAAGGVPVTRIKDSPGFVAQRTVATIVNIACDIAQQGVATPADIDAAVTLGLGYPKGPLALGDALGPARIVTILARLSALTGDPRYRASPWLRRRAALGLSLLHVEA
ncbi:MAG: 3-hydroxyacyl-CoA dehydrogenase [Alphaproteobacteria bacterium]|nr:3-hydroxyacyl-CoA dehydrogenase [Alphaproteobacteria bacterium]